MKNFGTRKTIQIDESKSYLSARAALEEIRFTYIGVFTTTNPISNKTISRPIFKAPNGLKWAFVGMEHFNTSISEIYICRFLGTVNF
ncbi:MAG: hypothetical protein WC389_18695 [Lutibacter sp.]|jgi:hypothetical protein